MSHLHISGLLQSMRDQNWRNLMEDWKTKVRIFSPVAGDRKFDAVFKVQIMIRTAQLTQHNGANLNRHQTALEILLLAEMDAEKHIREIKNVLEEHDVKGKVLKEEAALLRQKQAEIYAEETVVTSKGKGKAREESPERLDEGGEDEDPEEQGLPKTPAGEEHRAKRMAIKQRLREGTLTMHRVKFFQGDVYHVLGNSEAEDAAYQAAERLRRELLKSENFL